MPRSVPGCRFEAWQAEAERIRFCQGDAEILQEVLHHEPRREVGDLLTAEVSEKQARSIKYQIAVAKLPLAKEIEDFVFGGTPINETLVRALAGGRQ